MHIETTVLICSRSSHVENDYSLGCNGSKINYVYSRLDAQVISDDCYRSEPTVFGEHVASGFLLTNSI